MATNAYINTRKVAAASVAMLMNGLNFVKDINQKYTKEFKAPTSMGKTVDIRIPFNPGVRDGATFVAEDFGEQSRSLKIDTQKGVDVEFTLLDLELELKERLERDLKPRIANLATAIERDVMKKIIPRVSNVLAIASADFDKKVPIEAHAALLTNLCPDERLKFYVNPNDEADILYDMIQMYNPGGTQSDQYKKGKLTDGLGFEYTTSTLIPKYVTGTNTVRTGAVLAANYVEPTDTDAKSASISISGLSSTGTIKAGETFTIAGINQVNYQDKETEGFEYQIVVLADATATGGAAVLTIAPLFGPLSGQFQNIETLPVATDVITLVGAENSSYSQSIAFHPDFATVSFVDPKVPAKDVKRATYTHEGISLKFMEATSIENDSDLSRFDAYYGVELLWSPYAIRIIKV